MKTDEPKSKESAVNIVIGALCDPLSRQLRGLGLTHEQLIRYDLISNAITAASIHGCITDSETKRARDRLLRKIADDLKSLDK